MTTQTDKTRKKPIQFSPSQKLEYAKLMIEENYSNKQIIATAGLQISGACSSTVARWKKQYQLEKKGELIEGKVALDSDKCRIQELEEQLRESKEDVRLLKKAEISLKTERLCQLFGIPVHLAIIIRRSKILKMITLSIR